MLHRSRALCSLDFCWRSSGTQESPSHWATLPDDSVKKARDKAVTPNRLFWPEMGQTLTQAVVQQIHFLLDSLNNLLFLWAKKPVRGYDQIMQKTQFSEPTSSLSLPCSMWLQPQSCSLSNYLKVPQLILPLPSTWDPKPDSPMSELSSRRKGRTFFCRIWAVCLEQALLHISWQMCTIQSEGWQPTVKWWRPEDE